MTHKKNEFLFQKYGVSIAQVSQSGYSMGIIANYSINLLCKILLSEFNKGSAFSSAVPVKAPEQAVLGSAVPIITATPPLSGSSRTAGSFACLP